MKIFNRFIFLLTCLCVISCTNNDGKRDIKDYYFPLKALKEQPKVYEYEYILNDTTFKMYWYYQTVTQGDSIYFVGTCYNDAFQQMLLTREQRFDNGMKLKDLFYFGIGTTGLATRSAATIEAGAVFPFQIKDDKGVFISVIKYKDPKDSTHETTITRNRRFIKDNYYDFRGKKNNAIEFEMKEEQAEHDPKKGGWQHIYTVQEMYAEGIGLVFTKRQITEGSSIMMRLVDIYTMKELEDKFAMRLKQ